MNKYIRNLQIALAVGLTAAGISSCTDEAIKGQQQQEILPGEVSYNDDGTLNVTVCLDLPEMNNPKSRALGEDPSFEELGIYMLVFQGEDGLIQYTRLADKKLVNDTEHNHSHLVTFTGKLEPTDYPVVIHLIATNQPKFSEQIGSGMFEDQVGKLYTDNGNEAYWQRIDIGENIPSREQAEPEFDKRPQNQGNVYSEEEHEKALRIMKKLSHVPMVRNFVKVSATLSQVFMGDPKNNPDKYEITGLYIINTPDRGTVAPYRATFSKPGEEALPDGFAEFFKYKEETKEYDLYSYRKMTDNPFKPRGDEADDVDLESQNYVGNLPSGMTLINTNVSNHGLYIASKSEKTPPDPVYFYERPAFENSLDRTYAIVRIKNSVDRENIKEQYYKIDLGHVWDPYKSYPYMGVFEYYNLLRNFHYEIKINRIDGDGYDTLEEAANGAVFNNVSSAVEAKSMRAISDGDDWIYVSRTSFVFTYKGQELILRAQYREGIDGDVKGGTIKNNLISDNTVLSDNDNFVYYAGKPGGYTEKDGYIEYTLTCVGDPGTDLPYQEFYIYRGPLNFNNGMTQDNVQYGLYRIVTLYMHERWQFDVMDTFPGLWEDPNELPDFTWDNDKRREIGQAEGSPLTLFFKLPPDLPMAIFPLEFVIESDRQNIQNAYQGNAVVRSVTAGESLFEDATTTRIQYVKTVTWKDYNGVWGDGWSPEGEKMVRCRFLTITDLAQGSIGSDNNNQTSETRLRVFNEYFGTKLVDADGKVTGWYDYQEDGFYRDNRSSDPTPRIWDFCSSSWNTLLANMNSRNTRYTGNANSTVENLSLIEGTTNNNTSMRSYSDENGYKYIETNNANDKFQYNHKYPLDEPRELRVDIMCTDGEGELVKPTVNVLYANNGSNTKNQNCTITSQASTDGEPYKKYTYVFQIPAAASDVDVEIKPANGSPTRFYKIEIYPRWDDLKPSE